MVWKFIFQNKIFPKKVFPPKFFFLNFFERDLVRVMRIQCKTVKKNSKKISKIKNQWKKHFWKKDFENSPSVQNKIHLLCMLCWMPKLSWFIDFPILIGARESDGRGSVELSSVMDFAGCIALDGCIMAASRSGRLRSRSNVPPRWAGESWAITFPISLPSVVR